MIVPLVQFRKKNRKRSDKYPQEILAARDRSSRVKKHETVRPMAFIDYVRGECLLPTTSQTTINNDVVSSYDTVNWSLFLNLFVLTV